MIQANELRIGNLLNWNADHLCGGISKVIRINEYGFEIESNKKCHPIEREMHEVEPIPLTPELLEACGFEKSANDKYGGWLSPQFNEERLRIRHDEFSFYFSTHEAATPVRLAYLHQLQNLYFALTGTELEVNLPTLNKRDIHPFMP